MEMRNFEVSLCLKEMKRKMKISETRENGEQSEGEKQFKRKDKFKKKTEQTSKKQTPA